MIGGRKRQCASPDALKCFVGSKEFRSESVSQTESLSKEELLKPPPFSQKSAKLCPNIAIMDKKISWLLLPIAVAACLYILATGFGIYHHHQRMVQERLALEKSNAETMQAMKDFRAHEAKSQQWESSYNAIQQEYATCLKQSHSTEAQHNCWLHQREQVHQLPDPESK